MSAIGDVIMTNATRKSLGANMQEQLATGPSAWAVKMLLKQGWEKGKGLGKNEDGIKTHVRVTKKEESLGVGFRVDAVNTQTWAQSMQASCTPPGRIGGSAAVMLDTSSDDTSSDDGGVPAGKGSKRRREAATPASIAVAATVGIPLSAYGDAPSFEDLYAATGGARLGMRARAEQPGKIARAEHAKSSARVGKVTGSSSEISVAAEELAINSKAARRLARSEKRAAKESKRAAKLLLREARADATAKELLVTAASRPRTRSFDSRPSEPADLEAVPAAAEADKSAKKKGVRKGIKMN